MYLKCDSSCLPTQITVHREISIIEREGKAFLDECSLKEDEQPPSTWRILGRILETEKKDKHFKMLTEKVNDVRTLLVTQ